MHSEEPAVQVTAGVRGGVHHPDDVVSFLRELHSESEAEPVAVHVTCRCHGLLRCGIGAPRTYVQFDGIENEPPYYESRSKEPVDRTVPFLFENSILEGVPEAYVDVDDAIEALAHFHATGELDRRICWEEI